jgi:hypothetical protein
MKDTISKQRHICGDREKKKQIRKQTKVEEKFGL